MKHKRVKHYKASLMDKARELGLHGLSQQQIADELGTSLRTLRRWGEKHPEFWLTIKDACSKADREVENACYKAACGYWEGEGLFRKYYAPESALIKFWLINRQRNQWREKTEVDTNITIIIKSNMPSAMPDPIAERQKTNVN